MIHVDPSPRIDPSETLLLEDRKSRLHFWLASVSFLLFLGALSAVPPTGTESPAVMLPLLLQVAVAASGAALMYLYPTAHWRIALTPDGFLYTRHFLWQRFHAYQDVHEVLLDVLRERGGGEGWLHLELLGSDRRFLGAVRMPASDSARHDRVLALLAHHLPHVPTRPYHTSLGEVRPNEVFALVERGLPEAPYLPRIHAFYVALFGWAAMQTLPQTIDEMRLNVYGRTTTGTVQQSTEIPSQKRLMPRYTVSFGFQTADSPRQVVSGRCESPVAYPRGTRVAVRYLPEAEQTARVGVGADFHYLLGSMVWGFGALLPFLIFLLEVYKVGR